MTASAEPHRTGQVRSGDVELSYRAFGAPTRLSPLLILHGANYYDSADWIEVGTALSADREVVALDARGFGASSWSPSKDYSTSAQLADIAAVRRHFGWEAPILLGHSRGGLLALRYAKAVRVPVAALVLVDWCPREPASASTAAVAPGGGVAAGVRQPPSREVFPDLAAALAATSRDSSSLEHERSRARFEQICEPVPGGYAIIRRDPMYRSGWSTLDNDGDLLWQTLADIEPPALLIRATRSVSVATAAVSRIRERLPHVRLVEIESSHDIAQVAPQELVAAVQLFTLSIKL